MMCRIVKQVKDHIWFNFEMVLSCFCLPWPQVFIEKAKGEILGVVIVESGWGSILPTVIIASMMHAGPAERSGRLNIGDQIMSINGTSLVGLPLSTCQSIIKVCGCHGWLWLTVPPACLCLGLHDIGKNWHSDFFNPAIYCDMKKYRNCHQMTWTACYVMLNCCYLVDN